MGSSRVPSARRHIIWDWNGTLLDDFEQIVASVNAVLASVGAPPIEGDDYRDHFTRPVQRFYERLLGVSLHASSWLEMQERFYRAYRELAPRSSLASGALRAVEAVQRSGASQSLLSMLRHDDLLRALEQHQLAGSMLAVAGYREGCGNHKATHLRAHLDDLERRWQPQDRSVRCVMIGDSLDDAHAAAEHGVDCVLYDGGSHHRSELERLGVPVAGNLFAAIRLAGIETKL